MALLPKWKKRTEETHSKHLDLYSGKTFDYAFIGDSMVERWETTGEDLFEKMTANTSIALLGVGGDEIRNLMYRLEDSRCILKNMTINKGIVLMIGTNNLEKTSVVVILAGILEVIKSIRCYVDKIHLLALPYRSDVPKEKVDELNLQLGKITHESITYHRFFNDYTTEDYDDHVHFNVNGYRKWYENLVNIL